MKIKLIVIAMFMATFTFAQKNAFDLNFGKKGGVATGSESAEIGKSVAVQADGKILTVGTNSDSTFANEEGFVISRHNKGGKLDDTFGKNGIVKVDVDFKAALDQVVPFRITVLPDGKIIVVGTFIEDQTEASSGFVMRFDDKGKFDTTFGNNGVAFNTVQTDIEEFFFGSSIQKDGKILACGYRLDSIGSSLIVERYSDKGVLDTSFAKKGRFSFGSDTLNCIGVSMDLQSNNDIIVSVAVLGANDNIAGALLKLNSKGILQTSFGKNGLAEVDEDDQEIDILYAIDVQDDDKIVVLDYLVENESVMMRRMLANGKPDNGFGDDSRAAISTDSTGIVATDFVVDKDGKIVVCGTTYDGNSELGLVVRINKDGKIDETIGQNGYVICSYDKDETILQSIALQADGKLVCTGGGLFDGDYIDGLFRIDLSKVVPTLELAQDAIQLSLAPNVAVEQTKLSFSLTETQAVSVQLIDIQGKIVTTFIKNEVLTAGAQQLMLELPSTLMAGTYFVQLRTKQGSSVATLIKH